MNTLASLLLTATIILAVAWLLRQVQRAITGEPLNIQKYLLLAAAIPMHWVVLLTPMPHKPIAIVAILTIYHNLQYHRLIWFHNQKYTRGSTASTGTAGASPATSESVEIGDGSHLATQRVRSNHRRHVRDTARPNLSAGVFSITSLSELFSA